MVTFGWEFDPRKAEVRGKGSKRGNGGGWVVSWSLLTSSTADCLVLQDILGEVVWGYFVSKQSRGGTEKN